MTSSPPMNLMKPESQSSYDHLKVTQVEMPPNLYVYGQPVNLHPAYQYDHTIAANNYGPVLILQQPADPLLTEDANLKSITKRNGACFYYTLCALACFSIFGIVKSIGLISSISNDDLIPRVIIGFVVCDFIEDFLNIASIFPAKEGIYRYNFDRMVLCIKILYGSLLFYIVAMICYIIYAVNYPDRNVYDNAFLVIYIICGLFIYIFLISTGRRLLGTLRRIKEIQELIAVRARVNV